MTSPTAAPLDRMINLLREHGLGSDADRLERNRDAWGSKDMSRLQYTMFTGGCFSSACASLVDRFLPCDHNSGFDNGSQ